MPKKIKYHCTHCGRRFEEEEKDILECPGCYWSTSVKREDDLQEKAPAPRPLSSSFPQGETVKIGGPRNRPGKAVLMALAAAAAAAGLTAFLIFVKPVWRPASGSAQNPKAVPASAQQDTSGAETSPVSGEEQQILTARVEVLPAGPMTPEEQEAAGKEVTIKTGFVRQLPSRAWSRDEFSELLEEQQRSYQVPLPRSYRKKLEQLFESAYEPAASAFESENLLAARNQWVTALAIPLYSEDIAKHRGVALTMLRPYITDVLSKIGALNNMLLEEAQRSREARLVQMYAGLREKIASGDWPGAYEALESLQKEIQALQMPGAPELTAPPYPDTIAGVDTHIRYTLEELLTIPAPAVADIQPLQADLAAKRAVIEARIPEKIETQKAFYESAMKHIEAGEWADAARELEKIRYPDALVKDAKNKIAVLEKLAHQKLDSSRKTG